MKKVLLILVDGMRPDAIKDLPEVKKYIENSAYTFTAETVMPSVTLPCHVSLFHSVEPSRHGTTTNDYAPQVRPIAGLIDVLKANRMKNGFFYSWEQLREVYRPGAVAVSKYFSGGFKDYETADNVITEEAIRYLPELDFVFLYLGSPDAYGHKFGWMSEEYMKSVKHNWECILKATEAAGDDYTVIVTADHGGHNRSHGTDMPEDMTIPVIVKNSNIPCGEIGEKVSILDLAPTIAKLMDVEADMEWEGKSLI